MRLQNGADLDRLSVSIQVTGDCNLACCYCYQQHKNTQKVDIAKAKRFIQKIVKNDQKYFNGYIDFSKKKGIILDFVGGEPLINQKACIELGDYFKLCCIENNRLDFYDNSIIHLSTNGTIFNSELAEFLKRHGCKHVGVSITIDGCKELHDKCRRFKNSNQPSYDTVIENLHRFRQYTCVGATKVTIAPENLKYLAQSVPNMVDNLKFSYIAANTVYEDVWNFADSQELYKQLKQVADYLLEKTVPNDDIYFGFFAQDLFYPETDFCNSWCGGNGKMLFMQYDGTLFNCIRFAETATERSLPIGDAENGITKKDNVCLLKSATRDKFFPTECKTCPIVRGCSDCIAYMYSVKGNFSERLKSNCDMHKARSLANVYFWNKYYIKNNLKDVFLMYLPIEEAVKYVGEDETNKLLDLSNNRCFESLVMAENQSEETL